MTDSIVNKVRDEETSLILERALLSLKSGDMRGFDTIYNLTKKRIYVTIYVIFRDQMIAEDLMQETYVALLEKIDKIHHSVKILPFLTEMAKNLSFNYLKKMKREEEFHKTLEDSSYHLDLPTDGGILLKQIEEILNDKEYMVFTLKVLGDYSFKEISKMKNIPVGTLTWLYQEARKKLEKKLGGQYVR